MGSLPPQIEILSISATISFVDVGFPTETLVLRKVSTQIQLGFPKRFHPYKVSLICTLSRTSVKTTEALPSLYSRKVRRPAESGTSTAYGRVESPRTGQSGRMWTNDSNHMIHVNNASRR